jgi:hypothetical protein
MKIRVNTQECLYIEINGWTYYIDDSTNEQIMDKWVTGSEEELPEEEYDPNSFAEMEANEGNVIEHYENNKQ